jgi:hypothetical protein
MFAADRMDTCVFKVSVAVPLICLAGLVLWHLVGYLAGKSSRRRKPGRQAPEPQSSHFSPKRLPSDTPLASGAAPDAAAGALPHTDTPDSQADWTQHARGLLALTRDEFNTQRFLSCLDHCKALAFTFPDLPEAAEAKQLAAQIKRDPARLQQACAALADSLAEMYLELAESWLGKGEPEQAAAALHQLVQRCPETRQAELARDRLRQLGAAEHHS